MREYNGPNDDRLRKFYKLESFSLDKTIESAAQLEGGATKQMHLDMALSMAVLDLINKQRFYFLGDPATGEATGFRRWRNTENTRYFETTMDGLLMILQIHRADYPQAFDGWDPPSLRTAK